MARRQSIGVILGALLALLPVPFCVTYDSRRWILLGSLWCVVPVSLAEIVGSPKWSSTALCGSQCMAVVHNWDTDPKVCTLDGSDVCVQYSYPAWKGSSCPYTGRTGVLSWALLGAACVGLVLCASWCATVSCCSAQFWPSQGAPRRSEIATLEPAFNDAALLAPFAGFPCSLFSYSEHELRYVPTTV